MLNVDLKILSKALADRLKKFLPFPVSSSQTANVDGRFISEGGRLNSDILHLGDFWKVKGLLITIDIQKAFVDHLFFD